MQLVLKLLFLPNELSDVLLGRLVLIVNVTLMSDSLVVCKDGALVGERSVRKGIDFRLVATDGGGGGSSQLFVIVIKLS